MESLYQDTMMGMGEWVWQGTGEDDPDHGNGIGDGM
jgi:hypothetical protein